MFIIKQVSNWLKGETQRITENVWVSFGHMRFNKSLFKVQLKLKRRLSFALCTVSMYTVLYSVFGRLETDT